MEAPIQEGSDFVRIQLALGERGRALSGAEQAALDQASNHAGFSPEVLANVLEGAEEDEKTSAASLIARIVAADSREGSKLAEQLRDALGF
jgi:hypothetical protein